MKTEEVKCPQKAPPSRPLSGPEEGSQACGLVAAGREAAPAVSSPAADTSPRPVEQPRALVLGVSLGLTQNHGLLVGGVCPTWHHTSGWWIRGGSREQDSCVGWGPAGPVLGFPGPAS